MPNGVIQFGGFELVELVAQGGMAEVWKARLHRTGGFVRNLVVKRILPRYAQDPKFVQMFIKEARLSARLEHPNIVQVFDFGEIDGEYFLAMEYVAGLNLTAVMQHLLSQGLPPIGFGVFVVREMCRALAFAHALTDESGAPLRLIHRDVSPSNVMISYRGEVKLLDFGVAKALAEHTNSTQMGVLKGKLWYMAPERVDQQPFDHRSDLFSAGAILHETLVGRRLFKFEGPHEILRQMHKDRVTPPSVLRPEIPPELDRICLRALSESADARYSSGEQMAADLDLVLAHVPFGQHDLEALLTVPETTAPLDEAGEAVVTVKGPTPAPWSRSLDRTVELDNLSLSTVGGGASTLPTPIAPPPVSSEILTSYGKEYRLSDAQRVHLQRTVAFVRPALADLTDTEENRPVARPLSPSPPARVDVPTLELEKTSVPSDITTIWRWPMHHPLQTGMAVALGLLLLLASWFYR
jgi:serine/threonine protein kinase